MQIKKSSFYFPSKKLGTIRKSGDFKKKDGTVELLLGFVMCHIEKQKSKIHQIFTHFILLTLLLDIYPKGIRQFKRCKKLYKGRFHPWILWWKTRHVPGKGNGSIIIGLHYAEIWVNFKIIIKAVQFWKKNIKLCLLGLQMLKICMCAYWQESNVQTKCILQG